MANRLLSLESFLRASDQWPFRGKALAPALTLSNSRNRYRYVQQRATSSSIQTSPTSSTHDNFSIRKAQPTSNERSSKATNILVVLFGFYKAPETAIKRYCDLYHAYGFDVVYVKSVLKHFSWPKNSVLLADSVLKYLENQCSNYDKILVHAFSMGAYNFTVCMGTMYDKPELYARTQGKICGIVYDSLTIGSLENMSAGVAAGISTNTLVKKMIIGLTNMYFSATYSNTVTFYDHYVNLFKVKPLPVATLFFYSRNDPMSDANTIEETVADWRGRFSFPVIAKGWDKSKHAAHLLIHDKEYQHTLDTFLRDVPELAKELKIKSSKL